MTQGPMLSIPHELIPRLKTRMDKKVATTEAGCLEWTGTMSIDGYGITSVTVNGKTRALAAHRASWMVHRGPIGEGLVLDHLCRVRKCINVEHLEPITANENTQRGRRARKILPPVPRRPDWIDTNLWTEAKTKASTEGVDLASILRNALRNYVQEREAND